ncbi:tRNA(Met) cytidine acetyltransferase TmcA [Arhodomonas sp. KWT2]|uniref:tRNA(Met) cytidine acetyltransferase TmcA n=1 Tax=Arhodomonas sp. KWT2 TaxID=3344194 RepID=UPI0035BF6CE0
MDRQEQYIDGGVDALRRYLAGVRDPAGRYRRLVVLPPPTDAATAMAAVTAPAVLVSDAPPDGEDAVPLRRAATLLGSEYRDVVVDVRAGLDVDALAAVAGAVIAGGVMVVITPALEDWPGSADPALAGRLSWPAEPADAAGHFRDRLVRCLREDPQVAIYPAAPGAALPRPAAGTAGDDPACLTSDQAAAVAAVIAGAGGAPHRPCVLIADRGRGKSTALGIAARRLLEAGSGPVLVTAPRRRAAEALIAAATVDGCPGPRYLPPDQLIREPRPAGMLLVDEAAGLPAPMLDGLLARYPRIAFATTVHGYEGTGAGFRVRFLASLDRRTPQWQEHRLTQPVRWADGDPLEALLFRALLLDAEPADLAAMPATGQITTGREPAAALARDESALREFYGLLVDAHYQTRPDDLRRSLEAPDAGLWAARDDDGHIVAAAVTLDEGELPQALHTDILAGRRRLQGHLLPQSLAGHGGLGQALALRHRRVHRIAVHPALRGHGTGQRLMATMARAAREDGLDTLGTVFGATPALLRFYRRCGLAAVQLGHRRDAASASHAAFMLRPLSGDGATLTETARARFARDIPWRLAGPLTALDPGVVAALMPGLDFGAADDADGTTIAAFSHGHRGPDDAGPAVQRKLLHHLAASSGNADDDDGAQLLVARFLQHRPWDELAARAGVSGRRAVIGALRAAAAVLIAADT